jgi:DNA-binding transcriptional ArsR family regulator
METTDADLDAVFLALADPTRRALLDALRAGRRTVTELAAPFPVGLPAISKHLAVLERAGLIARERDGQRRHCSLRPEPFGRLAAWSEHYTRLWVGSLGRLEDVLREEGEAP